MKKYDSQDSQEYLTDKYDIFNIYIVINISNSCNIILSEYIKILYNFLSPEASYYDRCRIKNFLQTNNKGC